MSLICLIWKIRNQMDCLRLNKEIEPSCRWSKDYHLILLHLNRWKKGVEIASEPLDIEERNAQENAEGQPEDVRNYQITRDRPRREIESPLGIEAMISQQSENWQAAMKDEMNSLIKKIRLGP